jgi:exonuclease SbcD
MKILHTADWHIGKVLHKHPLEDELSLFFDWLIELITIESIDLLLVSGDIFDMANPTVKDRKSYYHFLSRLRELKIQAIITGGNHDSIGVLNAPQELLGELQITVIGGATDAIEDELILVKNNKGTVELVVAAVPFLRDRDLRNVITDDEKKDRITLIQEGIKKHYAQLAEICEEKYPKLPVIAMGHLFAKGVVSSDSEREIQIGNAAVIESSIFSSTFDYVALGHIHRPQVIGKNENRRYSGSPIPLSFSEKKDEKVVIIIEVENGKTNKPKVLPIPKNRELKKIKGTLAVVKEALDKYSPNFSLVSFVEILVEEEKNSILVAIEVEELVASFAGNEQFKILKNRTVFSENKKDTADVFEQGRNIEDIGPEEVFRKKMELELPEEEDQEILMEAFQELLKEVYQAE